MKISVYNVVGFLAKMFSMLLRLEWLPFGSWSDDTRLTDTSYFLYDTLTTRDKSKGYKYQVCKEEKKKLRFLADNYDLASMNDSHNRISTSLASWEPRVLSHHDGLGGTATLETLACSCDLGEKG